ncbi:hypothetical protein KDX31_14060 [Amphritea atlantica]|uniref:Sulfotransferase family protein n=1 Tax=Amphritea atlantica TaxID=355243 RepID=A0ABY5GSC0_9GAMM|nr:hypothetical protein KDX31_14060 [Amphritea atlantica]
MLSKLFCDYRKYKRKEFYLIYQMGKVGSDAVCGAIGDDCVEHIHTLYGGNPNDKYLQRNNIKAPVYDFIYYGIKRFLLRLGAKNKKLKVITLVRDPISRDPSMFFQDLDGYVHQKRKESYSDYISFNTGGVSRLISLYEEVYDFEYGLSWFERELKRYTGIDIYESSFVNGFVRVENDKFDVLCLRMEKLDELEAVLSDFCNRDIHLIRRNESVDKWYKSIYESFRLNYKIGERRLDQYKQSKLYLWLSVESEVLVDNND